MTVAIVPNGTTPSGHVTTPAAGEQLPWLGVAETNITEPGSVSVTTTPAASEGPRFVTVMVYVTSSPAITGIEQVGLRDARGRPTKSRCRCRVALSFAGFVSTAGDDVTEAVFTSVGDAYPGATASVS